MKPKNSENLEESIKKKPTSRKEKSTDQTWKKFWNLFGSLFGKKSKKSFGAMISHLTEIYEKEGFISVYEKKMLRNIATFGDKKVASIMTPRSDIIAVKDTANLEEIRSVITNDGHTRIPVYQGSFDHVIGFLHSKDLAKFICDDGKDFAISRIIRKIIFVPGSMKLMALLLKMRSARIHIAIVLDEFGGVDGIISIENLVEEIIGEIEDEHDIPLESAFFQVKKLGSNLFSIGGRVEIEKLEEILNKKIANDGEFQTVGGFVMAMFGRVPENGEVIEKFGAEFKVLAAESRVVKMIEVRLINYFS
jgi:CBS domain containing-hemolysin-like protein